MSTYDKNAKAFGKIMGFMRKRGYRKGSAHRACSPSNKDQRVKVKKLGKILSFTVWSVDGEDLRNRIDIDFVAGGNPARYDYIPLDEIWVESNIGPKWMAPVIVHEVVETVFMVTGRMTYTRAHDEANKIETRMRRLMIGGKVKSSSPVSTALSFLQSLE